MKKLTEIVENVGILIGALSCLYLAGWAGNIVKKAIYPENNAVNRDYRVTDIPYNAETNRIIK